MGRTGRHIIQRLGEIKIMKRSVLAAFVGLCAVAGTAYGQGRVQGNWEGKFTKGDLKGKAVTAKVVGESDSDYRVIFSVEGANDVEFHGKTEHGTATFFGGVDLGETLGGRYAVTAVAEAGEMRGKLHGGLKKENDFELKRVEKPSPTLGQAPPEGAIVLMDGASLDKWVQKTAWTVSNDGAAHTDNPSLVTADEYGSGLYHVEFKTPYMPNERGQARGNSGVYILGRYEVQVLDSWPLPPADNEAGGIYKQAVPLVNASLPPDEWQTYDIDFTAPEFDAAGKKTKNARITVRHNGIVIHDDLELTDLTPGGVSGTEAPKGPLMLQDHGDKVQFRNVWFVPK